MVSELDYGQDNFCSGGKTKHTTDKHDNEPVAVRKTTTVDGHLERQVVQLAALIYESVFRESNRAGNIGASLLQLKKDDLTRLKLLKT